jgi:acyl dehydratase
MSINIRFEDVAIGDPIPEWSRATDFMHWNRFAAVNDEFMPFHMDDEEGRKAGNPGGAFGMGNLRYAYMLNALQDWVGDEVQIRELACAYKAMNQKGDVLTVRGRVVDKLEGDGEPLVRIVLDVFTQDGASTCPGHALVAVPRR